MHNKSMMLSLAFAVSLIFATIPYAPGGSGGGGAFGAPGLSNNPNTAGSIEQNEPYHGGVPENEFERNPRWNGEQNEMNQGAVPQNYFPSNPNLNEDQK